MKKQTSITQIKSRMMQVGAAIVILAIFLATYVFLFFQFRDAALQSILLANEKFGNHVNSVLTLSNANIRTSAMQVFYTSSIKSLRTSSDLSWAEQTIGHRDLGNFVSSSNFIDNIMIYNSKLDKVFTSESSYGSALTDQFHDQEAVYLLMHPEEHSYLAPFKRQVGNRTHYSFLFSENGSSGLNSMLMDINADWYEEQLLGNLSRENHCIVDADGNLIFPTRANTEITNWDKFVAAFSQNPISGYITLNEADNFSSCWVYQKLGQTNWYYLEFFSLETDAPGLVSVRNVVFPLFALITLAILVLTGYFLTVILPTFYHIHHKLAAVSSKETALIDKFDVVVSAHQAYEQNMKIQDLQAGIFPSDTVPPVVILSTSVECGSELLKVISGCDSIVDTTLISSEQGDTLILSACTIKTRNRLLSFIQNSEYAIPIFASSPCYSDKQLLEAFAAIEELRNLAFLYPERQVLNQEMLGDCNAKSGLNPETVSSIESYVKKGQLDMAQAQWLLFFDSIRKDRYNDFLFAITYLDKKLTPLFAEYNLEIGTPVEAHMSSIADLHSHICSRLTAISEAAEGQRQQATQMFVDAVWDKIYQLYEDEGCCLQMIADQMGASPNYLNRQFRSGAGLSINDAIQYLRVDKVCKLLRLTDLPVEQIAKQVGYSNTKYFYVIFKKHTSKTPSQYRADLLAEEQQKEIST